MEHIHLIRRRNFVFDNARLQAGHHLCEHALPWSRRADDECILYVLRLFAPALAFTRASTRANSSSAFSYSFWNSSSFISRLFRSAILLITLPASFAVLQYLRRLQVFSAISLQKYKNDNAAPSNGDVQTHAIPFIALARSSPLFRPSASRKDVHAL